VICGSEPATADRYHQQRSELETVSRIVSDCGATLRIVKTITSAQELSFSSTCALPLVALGKRAASDDPVLEVIRILRRKGFTVICYENGLFSYLLREADTVLCTTFPARHPRQPGNISGSVDL
jgi:hypothetical protein